MSCQQCCSNQKSHIQRKQQSAKEEIEKDISTSIGEQNISIGDNNCMEQSEPTFWVHVTRDPNSGRRRSPPDHFKPGN
eukprot:5737998-Ditylum_brightwellii.AAC.1